MDLVELTQCSKILDFQPLRQRIEGQFSTALPAISWNNYLLTGFDKCQGLAINQNIPLSELMRDCYPKLSLPEVARFLMKLSLVDERLWENDLDRLLMIYHLQAHQELIEICEIILELPLDLQNWISEKSLKPGDLYPIRQIKKRKPDALTGFVFDLFQGLKNRRANREQTVQIISLACNLWLSGHDIWPKFGTSISKWLQDLETKKKSGPLVQLEKTNIETRIVKSHIGLGLIVKFNIKSHNAEGSHANIQTPYSSH